MASNLLSIVLNKNMKISPFLIIVFCFSYLNVSAQLTQGNWLVGGTGNFYSYADNTSSSTYNIDSKMTRIDISPSVGYFLIDKLALGFKPTFSSIKGKVTNTGGMYTNVQRYWIGPFGRYYLLDKENPFNIVTEISYQFGIFNSEGQKGNLSKFSALVGPVIYFNSCVGLEFLLGYSQSKEDVELANKIIMKGFQAAIGFQIHLSKN